MTLAGLLRRVRARRRTDPLLGPFTQQFREREGIEIGGPSPLFADGAPLPVYALARRVDNCQFLTNTAWQGAIDEGWTFQFHPYRQPGYQHLLEASGLHAAVVGRCYDFVLASHVIEHLANPALALRQWLTLLEPGGLLLAVLPNPRDTFDHRRPITPLAHLIEDYERGTGEDDLTHLDEILALHDRKRDPPAGSAEAFRTRSLANAANRCLHHHVFTLQSAVEFFEWCGYRVNAASDRRAVHLILIASRARP